MNKFKKIMSVLITAIMLLQMVGLTGSASTPVVNTLNSDISAKNEIAATNYDTTAQDANLITVDGDKVTVTTGKTISYKINVPAGNAGIYKIWVDCVRPSGTKSNLDLTGLTELANVAISGSTQSESAVKGLGNSGNTYNMGRYSFPEGTTTITLSPKTADVVLTKLTIKYVGGIPVSKTVDTPISVHDFLYARISPGATASYSESYMASTNVAKPLKDKGIVGAILSMGSKFYAMYAVNAPETGVYNITQYANYSSTMQADVTMAVGTTVAAAAEAAAVTGTQVNDSNDDTKATKFAFSPVVLHQGVNYIATSFDPSAGNLWFNGIMVSYVGEALELNSTTFANNALTNGAKNVEREGSFIMTFGSNVKDTTENKAKVSLKEVTDEGDVLVENTTVTVSNNVVTLSLPVQSYLKSNTVYKLIIDNIENTSGASCASTIQFTTGGPSLLSGSGLAEIPAKNYSSKTDDVTVTGEEVTIPAGGSVSYNVTPEVADVYRLWVFGSGGKDLNISGIEEIDNDVILNTAQNVSAKNGWKTRHNHSNKFIMGRFALTPSIQGSTVTLSVPADKTAVKITKLQFENVSDISVASTGVTQIDVADYMYHSISSEGYDSVYVSKASTMPDTLGAILSAGGSTYQWVVHEIYINEPGAYDIIGRAPGAKNLTGRVTFQIGATMEAAAEAEKVTVEVTKGEEDTSEYAFPYKAYFNQAGRYYVVTAVNASAGDKLRYNGFTIERVGGDLEVKSLKANTSATAITDTTSKGADTFTVKFSRNVVETDISEDTVYITEGTTKLDAIVSVNASDEIKIVLKEALKDSTYTLNIDGLKDEYGCVIDNYTFNFTTDADGTGTSTIDDEITATNVKVPTAADNNKRDVTITGKILSSEGIGIKGRTVALKLLGETVDESTSAENGVFNLEYEIPLASDSQTFSFSVVAEYATSEKTVSLTYITNAQEVVILGQLTNADTATDVKTFIENPEYQAMFDINPIADMPAYTGFNKDLVYGQLTNLEVSDVNDFKTAYKKAILLETINQAGAADAETAVTAILASTDDCALLGIDKGKLDCVTGVNADALVDAIAALNVNDPAKTFEEELVALSAAVDDAIADALKTQYSKTDVTSLAVSSASAYIGQGFDVSLDVTPAQANLTEIVYIIEATNAEIIDSAVVTTEYEAATEIVEGKLVITVTIPAAAPVALATDVAVGKVSLSAPSAAGTYTVNLSGTLAFDEGISYPVVTNIAPKTVTLTTTQNSSEGSFVQSSTPVSGTSPRPTAPDKEEEPEDKPDTTTPGTIPVDPEPVSNFTDLAGNEWAIEAINALFDKGIISDNSEKKFRPNDNVTREEFVKMIIEALGLVHETYETDLNDVEKGAWYYPYVATAVEKGIVLGDENGYFHVGENISRQDMSVIIIRVLTKLEHPYEIKSTKFADDKEISDYARDAMYAAKNLAIINGVGDNMCAPKGTATRAMAAKVIYEMMRTVGL